MSAKHEPARFERIGWDEALAEIAGRWRTLVDRHGAECILPYSFSGTLGVVQMEVAGTRFWNRLGASRLVYSICGAAAETAVRATLGARFSPPYHQVTHSRLCILWGTNPVSTAPHFAPFLREARRRGCEVVVIDPLRTRTARSADLHLPIRPGTDAALALAMGHVIVRDGLHDEDWLARHALGFEALRERLAEYPPERAAAVCGIDAAAIEDLARRYATTRPSLIKTNDGINRNLNGGQSVRALACLPALTGQYGVRGGGLAYSASDTLSLDEYAVAGAEGCPPPAREINMNRLGAALTGEAIDPPVMSLYVFGANPAAMAPNAGLVAEGLRREDLFTVVHEQFMTDTARLADIVLPATTQLEQADLHTASGHTVLGYNAPAIAPLGEARSNWDTTRALAAAMGMDHPSLTQDADEIIDELLAASARREPRLAGISPERLRREGFVAFADMEEVPFADGVFPTPSGRVELFCEAMREHGADPLPGWRDAADDAPPPEGHDAGAALTLVTPAAHHFVSSTFANHDDLRRRERGPLLLVHPDDAAARGIADGARVRVLNRRGWCEMAARVDDAVRQGVAVSPKGFWGDPGSGRNVNWTTPDALADLAGQSTFHSNRVWLVPVAQHAADAAAQAGA